MGSFSINLSLSGGNCSLRKSVYCELIELAELYIQQPELCIFVFLGTIPCESYFVTLFGGDFGDGLEMTGSDQK